MARVSNVVNQTISQINPELSLPGITPGAAQARGLESLAKGLTDFGVGVGKAADEYLARREALTENNLKQRNQVDAMTANEEAKKFALDNVKSDGSNLVELRNQKFQELKNSYFEQLSQDEKDKYSIIWDTTAVADLGRLHSSSREMQIKHVVTDAENRLRQRELAVYNSPEQIEKEFGFVQNEINGLTSNGAIRAEAGEKWSRDAGRRMVYQAVNGLVDQRKYQEARNLLTKTPFGSMLDGENELTPMLKRIRESEFNQMAFDLKMKEAQDRDLEDKKKQGQQMTFQRHLGQVTDPRLNPDAVEGIINKSRKATALGLLTTEQQNYIENVANKSLGRYNDVSKLEYYDKINTGDVNFDQIQSSIMRDVGNNKMDAQVGNELMGLLNTKRESIRNDPSLKERYKLGENLMNTGFDTGNLQGAAAQQVKLRKVAAQKFQYDLIQKGEDPFRAAAKAVDRFTQEQFGSIEQQQQRLNKKIQELKSISSSLSKEEYAKKARSLTQQQKLIGAQREAKRILTEGVGE